MLPRCRGLGPVLRWKGGGVEEGAHKSQSLAAALTAPASYSPSLLQAARAPRAQSPARAESYNSYLYFIFILYTYMSPPRAESRVVGPASLVNYKV